MLFRSGVGAKTAPLFRALGIDTPRALLEYLPFRYEDLREPTPASKLGEAEGDKRRHASNPLIPFFHFALFGESLEKNTNIIIARLHLAHGNRQVGHAPCASVGYGRE